MDKKTRNRKDTCPYSREDLRALYDEHQSLRKVAKHTARKYRGLNVSFLTVRMWCIRRGIALMGRGGNHNPTGIGGPNNNKLTQYGEKHMNRADYNAQREAGAQKAKRVWNSIRAEDRALATDSLLLVMKDKQCLAEREAFFAKMSLPQLLRYKKRHIQGNGR